MTEVDAETRILVVDDERFFREAIREVLSADHFPCVVCEDGEAALKLAVGEDFAVAILDIRLPGIDGIEVLRQLRIAHPELRVIMLSASTDQELVLESLRLGACDYLAKPLHDEELMLAVKRAAAGYRTARNFGSLRDRLDTLVDLLEELDRDATGAASGKERLALICERAVRAVSVVLRAQKTSLLLLNDEKQRLDVVASLGRDLAPGQMDSVALGRGIAGRALADATPWVVEDIRTEKQFAADLAPDRYRSNSFAVAPIQVPGRQLGILCATDRDGGEPFRPEDLSLLRLISLQLAPLLCRELELAADAQRAKGCPSVAGSGSVSLARGADPENEGLAPGSPSETDATQIISVERARDALDAGELFAAASGNGLDPDAELARAICDAVVNEVEPASLLREALGAIEAALDADPVSLYLLDPETRDLVLESTGKRGLRLDHKRLACDIGLTGGVFARGQLIASANPERDPRFDLAVDAPMDGAAGSLLCVPVSLRGKTIGVCRVHRAHGASVSARTGEVLIAALSAAIRNVLLYRSLLDTIEEVAAARRDARSEPQR